MATAANGKSTDRRWVLVALPGHRYGRRREKGKSYGALGFTALDTNLDTTAHGAKESAEIVDVSM